MGMIKIYQGKSKSTKKKPGWQKPDILLLAWLKSVQTMSSGISKPKKACTKKIEVVASGPVIAAERLQKGHSLSTIGGAGTKPVARPEIMYKDNPEMLERELKARERKFATAPAYNKGPAQLICRNFQDMMPEDIVGKKIFIAK